MKSLSFQSATVPYLGSKKRQAGTIASYINPERHNVLVSAFAGGCSLELFVKHKLGLQVVSNDCAMVPYLSQMALLQNNHARIQPDDIYYLFSENENDGFVSEHYEKYFTVETCQFLDAATENVRALRFGDKKFLLSHLLVYYILHTLPYGKFGCTYDIRNIKENSMRQAIEEATESSESRTRKLIKATQHPLPILKELADRINSGITNNNKENLVYYEDVFSFLPKVQHLARNGAVLFADPPYLNSSPYHSVYDSIGEIILGTSIESKPSVFNSKEIEPWYDKFFELCQPFDLWLITMGAKVDEPDALHSERFLAMVRKHRPNVKLLKFENFNWSINTLSGKSPKECEEYLVIAER